MQKHVNLVDLVKSFPTNIFLQDLASIQQRTSLIQFDIWMKNQRKVRYRTFQLRRQRALLLKLDLLQFDASAVRTRGANPGLPVQGREEPPRREKAESRRARALQRDARLPQLRRSKRTSYLRRYNFFRASALRTSSPSSLEPRWI